MPKGKFTPFTEEQLQYLRDNYLNVPVRNMRKKLNASHARIVRTLAKMGLEIPKGLVEQRKKHSLYHKGQKAWNEGMKQTEFMSEEAIAKTRSTRFKKGSTPHNAKHNGYERVSVDGYVEVRVKKGVFALKHRVVWEKANGPIPEGMIVQFKDGNSLNVNLDNLMLFTRAENMLMNSRHYNEETVPSAIALHKLNKRIKILEDGEK